MTYTSRLLEGNVPGSQKVLGVSWNPVSDMLEFDIREVAQSLQTLEPTKQNIIGFTSKFYGPLGFLSPVIITLKVFFQELCKPSLTGMTHCQVNCCVNGNMWWPDFTEP